MSRANRPRCSRTGPFHGESARAQTQSSASGSSSWYTTGAVSRSPISAHNLAFPACAMKDSRAPWGRSRTCGAIARQRTPCLPRSAERDQYSGQPPTGKEWGSVHSGADHGFDLHQTRTAAFRKVSSHHQVQELLPRLVGTAGERTVGEFAALIQSTVAPQLPSAGITTSNLRLITVGGVCGLAWSASLRGWMAQLAGAESSFSWLGTFLLVLLPGVLVGGLLGWAESLRRSGGRRRWRWPAFAPVLFALAIADPKFTTLIHTGMGGGAWAAIYLPSLLLVLCMACSIPHRPLPTEAADASDGLPDKGSHAARGE